jgi:chromate transporter
MRALFRVFLRIGLLSFGGPTAQIAMMHRDLVDERQWLTEDEYLRALSFCMLLPGPEAMQLATYVGWKRQGVAGGLLAGLLFVLPGALVVLGLAAGYAVWGEAPLTEALFLGVKACVVIIVIEALLRVAKRALKSSDRWVIAGLAFLAIFALRLPFPLIILVAGLYGAAVASGAAAPSTGPPPRGTHTVRTVAVWLSIWWAPVALAWAAGARLLTDIGLFFSKLALVTFGGAYSVLAYMAQEAVQAKGWLTTDAMMDGLGLAETTPGPLILVTEFVGYLAGFAQGGWPLAVAAAAMTLWVTFAPCFMWIFAGAPWLERITARPRLNGALSAITAAVVGVILNLTLWFALHVFFRSVSDRTLGPVTVPVPDPLSLDWRAVVVALLAGVMLLKLHRGLIQTLAISAAAGLVLSQVG